MNTAILLWGQTSDIAVTSQYIYGDSYSRPTKRQKGVNSYRRDYHPSAISYGIFYEKFSEAADIIVRLWFNSLIYR